jgi:putative Holliday junction resolvase
VREVVQEYAVRCIVIGLPLHLDGTQSEMSEQAQDFAARVEKALGIPVEMMDERLSSWEAEQTLRANKSRAASRPGVKRHAGRNRRAAVDDVAAAIILRDYLDRARAQAGTRD